MELGGRTQGTQYDHMAVTGGFTLGGNLDVIFIGGFAPESGDRFNLFDYTPATLRAASLRLIFRPLHQALREIVPTC